MRGGPASSGGSRVGQMPGVHSARREHTAAQRRRRTTGLVVAAVGLAAATRTTLTLSFSSPGPPTKERVATEIETEAASPKASESPVEPSVDTAAKVTNVSKVAAPSRTLQDEMSTAGRLWTRAYTLARGGRSSAAGAVGLAWTKTLWVLAAVVGLQASARSASRPSKPARAEPESQRTEGTRFGATDAGKVKEALQQFDLPFFATTVKEEFKPVYSLRVIGNFRAGGLQTVSSSLDRLQSALEKSLGLELTLHCVRSMDDDTRLDILVRKATTEDSALDIACSSISFMVALGLSQMIASSLAFQQLGAIVAEGVSLPILSILMLLACGEIARLLVSSALGCYWRPPLFLPSPMLGFAGAFAYEAPASTWSERLAVSLASPVAIAVASVVLTMLSLSGAGEVVALSPISALSSLLVLLPLQCDSLMLAGVLGLTMASYSLLPHSPYGNVAWEALCGKRISQRLLEISSYFYPIMGILATAIGGAGWATLPMFWSFLMINFAPKSTLPVREEVTQVHIALKVLAFFVLVLAAVAAVPLPPQALGLETARTALEWA